MPDCAGSWDERLAICTLVGDLSPYVRRQLEDQQKVAIQAPPIAGGYESVHFAHDVPSEAADSPYPFSMSRLGVQWARYGGYEEDRVTVVAGDDPWDFALFYALRRLTSLAYWVPSAWSQDDLSLSEVAHAVLSHQPDPAGKAMVVSYSDRSLADAVAAALARVANDRPGSWSSGNWTDVLGDRRSRLFCRNTIGAEQSLGMHGGTTSIISTPIPDPRTRDIGRLQWMVDVRVRDWAPVQDPALGAALLADVDYNTKYARAAQGSIAYRAPHWFIGGGVPLEGQVATPRLRLPSLLEQLRVMANDSGHDVRLSDKGTYADECAVLLGGRDVLQAVLDDYARFTALWELCFSEEPTRRIQTRSFWESKAIKPVFRSLEVGTIAEAVARGLLHRGLVHKCARCSAEAWLETDDLAGPLRCPVSTGLRRE